MSLYVNKDSSMFGDQTKKLIFSPLSVFAKLNSSLESERETIQNIPGNSSLLMDLIKGKQMDSMDTVLVNTTIL